MPKMLTLLGLFDFTGFETTQEKHIDLESKAWKFNSITEVLCKPIKMCSLKCESMHW